MAERQRGGSNEVRLRVISLIMFILVWLAWTSIKLKRSNLNIYQDFEEENNYPQSFPDYDGSSFENHHNQGRTKQFERISKRKRNRGIDIRTEFIRDPLRTTTSIVNRSIYG